MRNFVKSTIRDVKLSDKDNHPDTSRALTYPKEVENDLVAWILQLLDLHASASVLSLQEKAKNVIRPQDSTFSASKGWVEKFFSRHQLSLRNCTSVSQKLTQQLEGCLTKLCKDVGRYIRIGKYACSLIGNMDETPAFSDIIATKSIRKIGSKEYDSRTSGCEKNQVTIALSATADVKILTALIIFKGATKKTTQKLRVSERFVIKAREKAWIDELLMPALVEDVLFKP